MDFLVLLGFLLAASNGKAHAFQALSPIIDDDVRDFSSYVNPSHDASNRTGTKETIDEKSGLDFARNVSLSSSNEGDRDKDVFLTKETEAESEADRANLLKSLLINFSQKTDLFPTVTEMSSDNFLLDRLSEIHRMDDEDLVESGDDDNIYQALNRRDIRDPWQSPIDVVDTDSFPWTYDAFYPREFKYAGNDYVDYSNSHFDVDQRKNSSAFDANKKDILYKAQQQYPRNYYYNDNYNINARRNYKIPENNGHEERNKRPGQNGFKKYLSKNSCRQYLEFLKYAFEKLDEGPDYRYEYIDDYSDEHEKRGRLPQQYQYPNQVYGRGSPDNQGHQEPILKIENHQPVENDIAPSSLATFPKGSPAAPLSPSTPVSPTTLISPTTPASPTPAVSVTSPLPPSSFYNSNIPSAITHGPSQRVPERVNTSPWNVISESVTSSFGQTVKESVTEVYPSTFGQTEFSSPPFSRSQEKHGPGFGDNLNHGTTQEHVDRYRTEFQHSERTTIPTSAVTAKGTPKWLFPENYSRNLGTGLGRTPATTNPTVGTPRSNWITHGLGTTPETPDKTTFRVTPEEPVPSQKKDEKDCNDKILPCPDTFNITYPLNGYCNRYVTCESGRAVRRICPDGLHFNIITKSCDLPHNSFCNYACSEPDGYYGIPGDCGGYFVCKNSFAEYRMCPPKMHWDIKHDVCTFIEHSTCPMKCAKENEVLHYEGDCKAYIICLNGTPYYHKCPPNTKFDRNASTCVPEKLLQCSDDPKLMTKIYNPNTLCLDMQKKYGTEVWCDYFKTQENRPLPEAN